MKCPKCQNEINSNAKFCTKCGCNLAVEMAKATAQPIQQVQPAVCAKCGSSLMPGAKFCTKCGTAVAAVPVQDPEEKTRFIYDANNNAGHEERTEIVNSGIVSNPPVQQASQQTASMEGDIVPPDNTDKKTKKKSKKKKESPKADKSQNDQEKAGAGLIAAVVILLILVAASGTVCFMVWNGTLSLPFLGGNSEFTVQDGDDELESATEETTQPDIDTEELFAEADALLAEGKSQITVDAEIINGMESLDNAIQQFAEKAEEAGDINLAADRIADAYTSYITAVIKHKDMLNGQNLSGSIYSQIMSEMNDAYKLADELADRGCAVDTSLLTAERDAFDASYTERVISTFDEFTTREAWSRTEAWNLMSETADNMFDPSDLDNPLRLRYAYALSWWIQRQIETELANGTITKKGAAIKIANMIETMDYNPMMIDYYIHYMRESGEDCSDVEKAYDDIVQHIGQEQGFWIGTDVDLAHFWYFNDFGADSVDDTNGVTPENRQWIRNRMSSVIFVTQ